MPKFQAISPVGACRKISEILLLLGKIFSFFCNPNFACVPRLNRRSDFHPVWFIGCQSQVIAFLEHKTAKTFPFPHFYPKTPSKGVWIGIFKPMRKILKSHIFKTTMPITTKFCTMIKTTNYALWLVQTRVKQIQDGGQTLSWKTGKCQYLRNGRTHRHEIWHARSRVLSLRTGPTVKISNF